MNNYEYIIASLPDFEFDKPGSLDVDATVELVRSQLDGRDRDSLDFLLSSYEPDNLNAGFYEKASGSSVRFIRDFFAFDLVLKNAKTAYLNKRLGRPEGTDVVDVKRACDPDPQELKDIDKVLEGPDLLSRERELDLLVWRKSEDLVLLDIFDIDIILSAVVRMKLARRWLVLDPRTGREMFSRLSADILKPFQNNA